VNRAGWEKTRRLGKKENGMAKQRYFSKVTTIAYSPTGYFEQSVECRKRGARRHEKGRWGREGKDQSQKDLGPPLDLKQGGGGGGGTEEVHRGKKN